MASVKVPAAVGAKVTVMCVVIWPNRALLLIRKAPELPEILALPVTGALNMNTLSVLSCVEPTSAVKSSMASGVGSMRGGFAGSMAVADTETPVLSVAG